MKLIHIFKIAGLYGMHACTVLYITANENMEVAVEEHSVVWSKANDLKSNISQFAK